MEIAPQILFMQSSALTSERLPAMPRVGQLKGDQQLTKTHDPNARPLSALLPSFLPAFGSLGLAVPKPR